MAVLNGRLDGKVALGAQVTKFEGLARWSGSSMASATAAGRLAALAAGAGGPRGAIDRILAGEQQDDVISVFEPQTSVR